MASTDNRQTSVASQITTPQAGRIVRTPPPPEGLLHMLGAQAPAQSGGRKLGKSKSRRSNHHQGNLSDTKEIFQLRRDTAEFYISKNQYFHSQTTKQAAETKLYNDFKRLHVRDSNAVKVKVVDRRRSVNMRTVMGWKHLTDPNYTAASAVQHFIESLRGSSSADSEARLRHLAGLLFGKPTSKENSGELSDKSKWRRLKNDLQRNSFKEMAALEADVERIRFGQQDTALLLSAMLEVHRARFPWSWKELQEFRKMKEAATAREGGDVAHSAARDIALEKMGTLNYAEFQALNKEAAGHDAGDESTGEQGDAEGTEGSADEEDIPIHRPRSTTGPSNFTATQPTTPSTPGRLRLPPSRHASKASLHHATASFRELQEISDQGRERSESGTARLTESGMRSENGTMSGRSMSGRSTPKPDPACPSGVWFEMEPSASGYLKEYAARQAKEQQGGAGAGAAAGPALPVVKKKRQLTLKLGDSSKCLDEEVSTPSTWVRGSPNSDPACGPSPLSACQPADGSNQEGNLWGLPHALEAAMTPRITHAGEAVAYLRPHHHSPDSSGASTPPRLAPLRTSLPPPLTSATQPTSEPSSPHISPPRAPPTLDAVMPLPPTSRNVGGLPHLHTPPSLGGGPRSALSASPLGVISEGGELARCSTAPPATSPLCLSFMVTHPQPRAHLHPDDSHSPTSLRVLLLETSSTPSWEDRLHPADKAVAAARKAYHSKAHHPLYSALHAEPHQKHSLYNQRAELIKSQGQAMHQLRQGERHTGRPAPGSTFWGGPPRSPPRNASSQHQKRGTAMLSESLPRGLNLGESPLPAMTALTGLMKTLPVKALPSNMGMRVRGSGSGSGSGGGSGGSNSSSLRVKAPTTP